MSTTAGLQQFREAVRRDRQFDFMWSVKDLELDVSHGSILYIEDLNVSFDGFKAINDLNFYVNAGELRCVIGPNGAGKTTMMDIITGKTRPDSGSAFFGQKIDLLRLSESEIAEVGIINPGEFSPLNSIELVIWVAIGGRATLYGAVIGAILVNYGKTYFTGVMPEAWLFALGGLFVLVTLFLPRGFAGLFALLRRPAANAGEAAA